MFPASNTFYSLKMSMDSALHLLFWQHRHAQNSCSLQRAFAIALSDVCYFLVGAMTFIILHDQSLKRKQTTSVRDLYSIAVVIRNSSIYFTYVGSTIDSFMAYYRQHFLAASILPKMHFLEVHTVSYIEQ